MLQVGASVGRYQILRRLADGGMGTLYLAHDPILDRDIALKLFLGGIDLPGARERFVREARAAAGLSNPNIVTVYDYGDYESQPYIAMEYIHGQTLAELIHRKLEIPVPVKLRWIEELCSAVGYAHGRGIIHRDIKPSNLMVDSYQRLKVLDFGIARMRGSLASKTTALIGTPGYCAPEQFRGGEIDHRSDIFSIGVVCYELLSYVEPFPGDTVHVITHHILNEEPASLSHVCPGIDGELVETVAKALRKSPDERFSSAEALRDVLAAVRARIEADSDVTTARFTLPSALLEGSRSVQSGLMPGSSDETRSAVDVTIAPRSGNEGRRTDREMAARRKAAEVQEQIAIARERLQSGDLLAAQRACDRGLALDAEHPEVRAISEMIATARERAASELLTAAHGELTLGHDAAVEDLLQRASGLVPDHPDAAPIVLGLRVLRADQARGRRRTQAFVAALEAAEAALKRQDLQEALGRAREALEIDPGSVRARQLEQEALQPAADHTEIRRGVPQAPTARSTPAPLPPGDVAPTVLRPRPSQPGPSPTVAPPSPAMPASPSASAHRTAVPIGNVSTRQAVVVRGRRRAALTAVAAILVLAAIGAAALRWSRAGSASPPALVVIDALPWALVTEVQRDNGAREPLPASASTPLALRLRPGAYHVTLQGPPPQSEVRTVALVVEAGKPATLPAQRFSTISADEYFKPYLTATPPISESAAPAAKEPQ